MTDMKKVNSGDPLIYPATTHNRFVDATLWAEAQRASKDRLPKVDFKQDGICRVKNDSGENLPRFSILGISEPLYSPRTKLQKFQQEYSLLGVIPETPTHECKFVVLAEPIPDGEIGFAWCDGIAPVLLEPDTAEDGERADIIDGETSQLEAGQSGPRIIWRDDTDDDGGRWALIQFGDCGDANDSIPGGDCLCCPSPCVCYPEDEADITTDCEALPCLLLEYGISGNFPWGNNESSLAHDAGCDFLGSTFNITVCEGTALEEDLGDHQWDMTVGAGIHESEVHLTGDTLSATWVSTGFFHPLCGNEFVLKPDCADSSLSQYLPRKICVNAVGEPCEPCQPYGIGICDGACTIQSVLYATLDAPTCAALDGLVIPLYYIGVVDVGSDRRRWIGEFTVTIEAGCTMPFKFHFDIIGGIACEWDMCISDSTPEITNPGLYGITGYIFWGSSTMTGTGSIECPVVPMTSTFVSGSTVPACISAMSCLGTMQATVSETP